MLIITLYFNRGLWRVKRSDKELSTFTDPDFITAYVVASKWAIHDGGRMVVIGKQDIGIGQLDFCRLDIGDGMYDEIDKEDEDDKVQLQLDLEAEDD